MYQDDIRPTDIQCDGYFIGDLALRHSEVVYHSMKDTKYDDWTAKLLLRTSIALCKPVTQLDIVSGLPLDFYFSQRLGFEQFILNLSGSHVSIVVGKSVSCYDIDIRRTKLVPQHLGAAMDYLLDDTGNLIHKEDASKDLLIIDPGYNTLGLMVLSGMEIGKESRATPGLGITRPIGSYRNTFSIISVGVSQELSSIAPSYQENTTE
jgi:hypothetical protein